MAATKKQIQLLAKLDTLINKQMDDIRKVVKDDEQLSYWMEHNLIFLMKEDIVTRKSIF